MSDEIKITEAKKRVRAERHLKWYERQWWSGALVGVQIGWMLGVVTAVPLMFLCKWLVACWMGS